MNDHGYVLAHGLSDPTSAKPFVMEINPETGATINFVHLERSKEDDLTDYSVTNGFYHDISDPGDGKEYYYSSFVYNHKYMQIVKSDRLSG